MKRYSTNGFSITELIVVLAICSIFGLLAMPSMTAMASRNQTTAEINRLVGAVNLTRHTSIQFGVLATLCGLRTNKRCGASWQDQLTVFLDPNQNARLDEGETIIARVQPFETSASVTWRAFQNRQYLQMTAMGYTNYQNGNFTVCPAGGDARRARQLIINIQGRTRLNHRLNDEGHPVDRRGKPLRC